MQWKTCPSQHVRKRLLGFINYLAKFLPRLSEVAQPLRNLTLTNAQFMWSEQHNKVYDEVKKLVANHPVLKYYDINDEVTIQCDASERGLECDTPPERTASCLRIANTVCS